MTGPIPDLKIEDFGDVYPLYTPNSGVMLDDRDPGGVLITRHTLTGGTDYWSLQDPLLGSGYVKTLGFLPTGTFPDIVTGPQPAIAINELRTDGINDGYNTIQGVRAYEPGLNGWTTPDAYAGDISDPMSRKSYMWNDDNPVSYSDPSGYEGCEIGTCGIGPDGKFDGGGPLPPCPHCYLKAQVQLGPFGAHWVTAGDGSSAHGYSGGAQGKTSGKGKWGIVFSVTIGIAVPTKGHSTADAANQTDGGIAGVYCESVCGEAGLGPDGKFAGAGGGEGWNVNASFSGSSASATKPKTPRDKR